MIAQRWRRIIPVALIMYMISYVDRTNISLALEPRVSSMVRDLLMDDRMKGRAAGIFFFGYMLLQVPGGYLATHWSARKVISLFLICWGGCAVACGLCHTFPQFELARFLLGVAESGVFPASLVLLANWFPRGERARANAYWCICQPLSVAISAPLTGKLLDMYGWQKALIAEGMLPFLWLPVWWLFISDHPRTAKWIRPEEREFLETTLNRERAENEPAVPIPLWQRLSNPSVLLMIVIYFLHNCAAYGCMTFFTSGLQSKGFSAFQYGVLFAIPYALTVLIMVLNSWHSDKTGERRGHVAAAYILSGSSLILSVCLQGHFWLSYAFLCLAIPGPFAALGPFWAISTEVLPRNVAGVVMGLINACGNLGGFYGNDITGWLKMKYHNMTIPFSVLGGGMLLAAALCFFLPKPRRAGGIAGVVRLDFTAEAQVGRTATKKE